MDYNQISLTQRRIFAESSQNFLGSVSLKSGKIVLGLPAILHELEQLFGLSLSQTKLDFFVYHPPVTLSVGNPGMLIALTLS